MSLARLAINFFLSCIRTAKKKAEQPADEVPDAKSPQKRKVAEEKGAMAATKRARTSSTKSKAKTESVGVELDDAILGKARAVGYESQLKNLSLRPDIASSMIYKIP